MTIDEIENMTEAEYAKLTKAQKADVTRVILETLCNDGLAYQGADGRYRIREDVELLDDGTVAAHPLN